MPYESTSHTETAVVPGERSAHGVAGESGAAVEPAVNSRPLSAAASLGDDVLDSIAQRVL